MFFFGSDFLSHNSHFIKKFKPELNEFQSHLQKSVKKLILIFETNLGVPLKKIDLKL